MDGLAIDLVRKLIGVCPVGYEYIEYIFAGCISIMFLKAIIMLLSMPIKAFKK